MAADELRQRVHDDVGAVLLRLAQVGRRQRVIDDERHAGLLGDGSDGRKVDEDAARVGDRLAKDRACFRRDRLLERRRIGGVRPLHVPIELLERVIELIDRAAVELAAGNELIARLEQRVEDEELRRVPRGDGKRRGAAFQRRDAPFQHGLRRVVDARVDVAEHFQPEQRGGVVGVVEDEGGGLIDRRRPRAGCGIRGGARMDGQGSKLRR